MATASRLDPAEYAVSSFVLHPAKRAMCVAIAAATRLEAGGEGETQERMDGKEYAFLGSSVAAIDVRTEPNATGCAPSTGSGFPLIYATSWNAAEPGRT